MRRARRRVTSGGDAGGGPAAPMKTRGNGSRFRGTRSAGVLPNDGIVIHLTSPRPTRLLVSATGGRRKAAAPGDRSRRMAGKAVAREVTAAAGRGRHQGREIGQAGAARGDPAAGA